MTAKVVPLATEREACRASVIQTLEAALADAREGRIIAVSISIVRPDGAANCSRSQTDDVARLLGAITLAQGRLLANLI